MKKIEEMLQDLAEVPHGDPYGHARFAITDAILKNLLARIKELERQIDRE